MCRSSVVAMRRLLNRVPSTVRREWRIILANALALLLAVSGWNYYDVRYFINYWFDYFKEGRPLDIYSGPPMAKVAYPPLAVYIFIVPHLIATSLPYSSIALVRLIDKAPLIAAFNMVYLILRRRYGHTAGNLWLLNYMVYGVIADYQFDLVAVVFLLMGFIYLTERKYTAASVMITLSALVKQLLAVFMVFPLIELFKARDYRGMARVLLVSLGVASVFIAPFMLRNPYGFIGKVLLFHGERYPQNYSLWALPVHLSWYNIASLPSWLTWVWIMPFTLALLILYLYFYRDTPVGHDSLLGYFALASLLMLVLNKVGNPNYYLWASVFLAIYIARNIHRTPRRLISLYIFIPLLIGLIAGFLIEFTAAVVGDDILMVEDSNWVSAEQLIAWSTGIDSILYKLIIYARSSPAFFTFFSVLNSARGVTATVATLLYNSYLIYTAVRIARDISRHKNR
ncbi:glycosyltransferase 87 family protein [Desulfurococcus mucosus]|uniref:GPI mannosyltransferase 1 n=1 Tax=Desulfurococcus mucosus (strain ATCC 35584 / DSM 2162 / JCM 9187 / O7/1) TaxID=765177 RepID=E8RA19_DESM0|nr:glycosyltransferase 87 family protein [Desulfurococcus mucosus]ADV65345.1 GPI mannosyltransferase 1 [Desulfurococcus mucosus DSM 2162]